MFPLSLRCGLPLTQGLALLGACVAACTPEFLPAPASAPPQQAEAASREADAAIQAMLKREAPIAEWRPESEPPELEAAYDDASAWGHALTDMMHPFEGTTRTSATLRCAAREIARIVSKAEGMPSDGVRRFVAGYCGVASPAVQPLVWAASLHGPVPEETIVRRAKEDLAASVASALGSGTHLVALATSITPERATVVVAVAPDKVRFDRADHVVDSSGRFVLAGRLNDVATGDPGLELMAFVNHAGMGVAACKPDPETRSPMFSFRCELDAGTNSSRVQLLGRRRGQLFGLELAEAIPHVGDRRALTYTRSPLGTSSPEATADSYSASVLHHVNSLRREHGMQALSLETSQSGENVRLVQALARNGVAVDDGPAQEAAQKLLAGEKIDAAIHDGALYIATVPASHDPVEWLASAVEQPLGRVALLAPDAQRVALGTDFGGAGVTVVTTFSVFTEDHSAYEKEFIEQVARMRTSHGRPAPLRVTETEAMRSEAALVNRQGKEPTAALGAIVQAASAKLHRPVQGYVVGGPSVEALELPWQLAKDGPLSMMVCATHRRTAGAAWAQLVVFVVVLG